ncbi:GntR family transcriptional regulator [Arthrobacter sp. Edens01]|uniref:GntR family transcriptional regulator n=1 Tax=Arthrobacter sp. Edens01 TaxID=1732020 RepID=UPI0006DB1183|nr:GntR family transcriptional regulator [Arthrobacter sp. Edens01]KPN18824.1 GntR family transcriptional regulator [Arthrobacter sp. Edens01]
MTSHSHPAPKYYVLKERIRALAAKGEPGTLISTERALAAEYGTSRTTVRQAIAELVAEGVLDRTQGHGTFVAHNRPTYVRQLTSFTEDAAAQHLRTSSELLGISTVPAEGEAAHRLQQSAGAPLTRVERIRLINEEPLAHETALLPGELPQLADALAHSGSLYAALQESYGIRITDAEDTVETQLAGPEDVRLLGLEMGFPLLLIHRLGLAGDTPAEWTRSVFRGDRFRFQARRHRD